jgi:hypothetical protein
VTTSHTAQEIKAITRDLYGPDATARSDRHGGITIDAGGFRASVPRQRSLVLDQLTRDYDDPGPGESPAT